jgi:hypothetical protein
MQSSISKERQRWLDTYLVKQKVRSQYGGASAILISLRIDQLGIKENAGMGQLLQFMDFQCITKLKQHQWQWLNLAWVQTGMCVLHLSSGGHSFSGSPVCTECLYLFTQEESAAAFPGRDFKVAKITVQKHRTKSP